MDINFATSAIITLFVLVVVAFLLVFRQRAKVDIRGPLHTGLKMDASNDPPPITPAIVVEGAKSRDGGLFAEDNTGRGANFKNVDVQDDILISSTPQVPIDKDPKD